MRKLLIVTALLLFAGIAFGQTLNKGGMVAIHEVTITLKPDVTMDQLLDVMNNQWFPELNKNMEGVTILGLTGDRGEKEGTVGWIVYCESEETRDRYWPEEGAPSEKWNAVMQKVEPIYEKLMNMATFTSVYTEWKIL